MGDSKHAAETAPRKSGGPVCEVCGDPATVVYLDHRAGAKRYFCANEYRLPGTEREFISKHWQYPLEVDGVFHELAYRSSESSGSHVWAQWTASRSQVAQRNERERAKLDGWRAVMFDWSDWSTRTDVDAETLRTAAGRGWIELQDLYRTNIVLEGDMFWQIRNEAAWLRSAMIHVCIDQGAAKQWQLELTPKPLTFCTGTARAWKRACGRIFPDTERESGGGRSYWLSWCDEHRPNRIAATRR
jgi:hypothetical protein